MQPKLTNIFSHASTAFAVLAIGILLSVAAAYLMANQVGREAKLKFENTTNDARDAIESRIQAYSDILLGVRGLFIASGSVSRDKFRDYTDSLDLNRRYPGIRSISFSQRVPFALAGEFENQVRRDTSIEPRGYPAFAIKPAGDRPDYVVLVYIEPMAGNEAGLGLDLIADARRDAIERTRDFGIPAATGRITLLSDVTRREPAFSLRLAVYRNDMPIITKEQRRAAFAGVVSATFLVRDLVGNVFSQPASGQIHLRIHDAGEMAGLAAGSAAAAENLLFDSAGGSPLAGPSFEEAVTLEIGGRQWRLQFSALQKSFLTTTDYLLPWIVLSGSLLISILLFGLTRSLATSSNRALGLANRITADLRQSEADLAEAQRMTQELIETLPNPIFFKDTDGRYLGVNKAWEKFFGVPRATFIGKTVHDLYPNNPEVADRLHSDDQVLWSQPGTKVYETSITTPDGRRHDAIYYKATFTNADGNVAGLIGTIVDITERKQAEAARAQLAAIVENSNEAIFSRTLDGTILSWNAGAEKMLGFTAAESIGKPIAFTLPPDRPPNLAQNNEMLLRGEVVARESDRITKDGRVINVLTSHSPIRDSAGNIVGASVILQDITARKQAETSLRESEVRYRSVIAAIAEGVVLRDKDARIVACNASAERILGRTFDQMKGNVFYDSTWQAIREDGSLFPDEERPIHVALRSGRLQSHVVQGLRRPDGAVLWLSMNVQPLFDESGTTLSGVVSTLTDITERKRAEKRLAMEHAITRVLTEAETLAEAIPRIIQIICETMEWHCGARWVWDKEAMLLRCCEMWGIDTPEVREFLTASANGTISPEPSGQGLVRRTFAGGEPVWLADVTQVKGLVKRAALVTKAGLHGAFAFPLLLGNEVLGVMEFFHRNVREPDEMLIKTAGSIGNQIGQFTARRQAEERVHHLAHYDELTGLPNRSMFNQRLGHALFQAKRHGRPLAILFIDLDRFKNINDTLGHEAGDRVLKEVAERLRGCLRESDTVGRLGGDEFVVLVEELPQPAHVAAVAQKILAAVAKPYVFELQEFHITASIGISAYPDDSGDMQSLLKNADIAMYRAKEHGKNNYQFYSAQINVHTLDRLALESNLRRALERNEFLLHYQPKVDIGSGRITGMEALVRWQQPARALIPPAQFIPLAEETGLIVPIGEWVLKTACARNKSWQDQGLPPLRIAVNLSARQFAHERLVEDVARVLNETGLDATSLELEITESMVMHDPERAVILLNKLKTMGIHLSIDDFGTGYSSLNYLKRFPIDSVKIDRSFIQDIPGNADDAAITQAIIAMAHSLRLKVIAEGVETDEQLRFLRDHECDEMQGYYFSRPLPENEFFRLLQDSPAAGAAPSSR